MIIFTVASIVPRMLGRNTDPPHIPFAAFADVFPGQPRSGVAARKFSCPMSDFGGYRGRTDEFCYLYLATGVFSRVGTTISKESIRVIYFTLRDNTLKMGDLMLLLGTPEVRDYGYFSYFRWPQSGATAVTDLSRGKSFFLLAVRSILIVDAGGDFLKAME
jgi:hypothetical protein